MVLPEMKLCQSPEPLVILGADFLRAGRSQSDWDFREIGAKPFGLAGEV